MLALEHPVRLMIYRSVDPTMKKLHFLVSSTPRLDPMRLFFLPALLIPFLMNPLPTTAQITLLSTDLTSVGDQITRWTDTVPAYGPGPAGAGVVWDFSMAQYDTIAITDVVTVASTPFSSTFASSDYAMTGGTGSYLYFQHDAGQMTTTGAAGDLLGTGEQIESPFSDPLVLHQFPRSYLSSFDDTYAFVTEADGAGLPTPFPVYRVRLTHNGHVYDTTDAYGTLITPEGTYQALRVKSVDLTTDLLEYKLFSFSPWAVFSNTSDTTTSFSWHAKEEKLAIAEFAYDSIGNPARFTFSTVPPVVTTAIGQTLTQQGIVLYPQPADAQLNLTGATSLSHAKAVICSLTGKRIRSEDVTDDRIDVSQLPPGMYILHLSPMNGEPLAPIRFVVQR